MNNPPQLRLLIACSHCGLQHDASSLAPGSRFHCSCGELLTVQRPDSHEAAVVRCSSCGAPREAESAACRFCGSDFTLHEQDLHTICPHCTTRISDQARFCHSCAAPISPQLVAGTSTDQRCPACDETRMLHSRPVDGLKVSLLECHRCAGIWISHDLFQHLEEKALDREIGWNPLRSGAATEEVQLPKAGTPLYRRCPTCDALMNRTNYGRRSGVIVDICLGHGIWFDHGELARILVWIRDGSSTRAQRQKILEDAEMTAARRAAWSPSRRPASMSPYGGAPTTLGRMLGSVLEALFTS